MTAPGRILITVDSGMCMGVQSCVRTAPGSFTVEGNVARGVDQPADDLATVIDAARYCPNFAITVAADGGVVFDPEA
jgi:ferredoxin